MVQERREADRSRFLNDGGIRSVPGTITLAIQESFRRPRSPTTFEAREFILNMYATGKERMASLVTAESFNGNARQVGIGGNKDDVGVMDGVPHGCTLGMA